MFAMSASVSSKWITLPGVKDEDLKHLHLVKFEDSRKLEAFFSSIEKNVKKLASLWKNK
jgi:hypothetical protein